MLPLFINQETIKDFLVKILNNLIKFIKHCKNIEGKSQSQEEIAILNSAS